MKTHVLILSRIFPAYHYKRNEVTFFVDKILTRSKIHTIRSNYDYWEKAIKDIQENQSYLSLRFWKDLPYRSKQIEFKRLYKHSGISIQKIVSWDINKGFVFYEGPGNELFPLSIETLAANDGLSINEFIEWFTTYDLNEPKAIIHFTDFKY